MTKRRSVENDSGADGGWNVGPARGSGGGGAPSWALAQRGMSPSEARKREGKKQATYRRHCFILFNDMHMWRVMEIYMSEHWERSRERENRSVRR